MFLKLPEKISQTKRSHYNKNKHSKIAFSSKEDAILFLYRQKNDDLEPYYCNYCNKCTLQIGEKWSRTAEHTSIMDLAHGRYL